MIYSCFHCDRMAPRLDTEYMSLASHAHMCTCNKSLALHL